MGHGSIGHTFLVKWVTETDPLLALVPVVWLMSEWRAVTIQQERNTCGSTDHFQQF